MSRKSSGNDQKTRGDGERTERRSRRQERVRVDYDEAEAMEIMVNADVEVFPTFDAMGLKEDLLRGIYSYGFFFWYIFKPFRNFSPCRF
jgi:hypothetical protein